MATIQSSQAVAPALQAEPGGWGVEDVIDLEYFVQADKQRPRDELSARDAQIYAEHLASRGDVARLQPRALIRLWLDQRRRSEEAGPRVVTPGGHYRKLYTVFLTLMAIAGGIVGSSLAASHLTFSGGRPINVLVFFSVTVLAQLLLFVLLSLGWAFRASLGVVDSLMFMQRLLKWVFVRCLGHDGRRAVDDVLAIIEGQRGVYGHLVIWPFLVLTQVFAIAFNLGVLATVGWMVTFTNQLFGWESTLAFAPESLHRVAAWIALPWSWCAPAGLPGLEQVAQSKILVGASGIPANPTPETLRAFASWWPFLCLSVLCYGLIPRALMLLLVVWRRDQALATLRFDHEECRALVERLMPRAPAVSHVAAEATEVGRTVEAPTRGPAAGCLVLLSTDLELSAEKITKLLAIHDMHAIRTVSADVDAGLDDQGPGTGLAGLDLLGVVPHLAIIAPAWIDCVEGHKAFLRSVRARIGPDRPVLVLLVMKENIKQDRCRSWARECDRDRFLRVVCEVCDA